MDRKELEQKILELVAISYKKNVEDLSLDTSFKNDLGGASVQMVALVAEIENETDACVTLQDAAACGNILERDRDDEVVAGRNDAADHHERRRRINAAEHGKVAGIKRPGPSAGQRLERGVRRVSDGVVAESERAAAREARATTPVAHAELDGVPVALHGREGAGVEGIVGRLSMTTVPSTFT